MKEYKYKINGIKFNVEVGDVEDNHVEVTVNGTHYTVELEKDTKAPVKINATKTAAAAPKTATGEKVISNLPLSARAQTRSKLRFPALS